MGLDADIGNRNGRMMDRAIVNVCWLLLAVLASYSALATFFSYESSQRIFDLSEPVVGSDHELDLNAIQAKLYKRRADMTARVSTVEALRAARDREIQRSLAGLPPQTDARTSKDIENILISDFGETPDSVRDLTLSDAFQDEARASALVAQFEGQRSWMAIWRNAAFVTFATALAVLAWNLSYVTGFFHTASSSLPIRLMLACAPALWLVFCGMGGLLHNIAVLFAYSVVYYIVFAAFVLVPNVAESGERILLLGSLTPLLFLLLVVVVVGVVVLVPNVPLDELIPAVIPGGMVALLSSLFFRISQFRVSRAYWLATLGLAVAMGLAGLELVNLTLGCIFSSSPYCSFLREVRLIAWGGLILAWPLLFAVVLHFTSAEGGGTTDRGQSIAAQRVLPPARQ